MKRNAFIQILCVSTLLLTATWANAARSVSGPPSFEVISQNNIFNRQRREVVKPIPPQLFSLNGTMSFDDTSYAFFDGASRRFQNRTLKAGDAIGCYVVAGVGNDSAIMRAPDGHVVRLAVGAKLAVLAPNISGESK